MKTLVISDQDCSIKTTKIIGLNRTEYEPIATHIKQLTLKKELQTTIQVNGDIIKIENIVALGDTKVDARFLKSIAVIPFVNVREDRSCKCFAGFDWRNPKDGIPTHTDFLSSWNCLMEQLNRPEYAIIFNT